MILSNKKIVFFVFFILIQSVAIGIETLVLPKSSSPVHVVDQSRTGCISDPVIEDFYSIPAHVWLKVLGDKGHYHFGQTNPLDLTEDIFDHAVRYLYRFIPGHSAILDCGCGWGAPARLFTTEKGCKVTGVTTSFLQYEFIQNHVKEIEVIYKDLYKYFPQKSFNTALFFESSAH
jgi:hypothetical protein